MMDFARKQLEKYGWSNGKGLGKYENGIAQPLKPKLKRSITGVGYDAAADLTEQWWSALYNKATSNVQVEEVNGKTKKIKTNEDFEITNSTWKLKRKTDKSNALPEERYAENFVKTAVLTSGGTKTKKVRESDSEEENVVDTSVLSDEQLFKACGGRTAHKGARHGLKALGKLARIEQQEILLLQQSKYNGYSQKKNKHEINEVVEELNLNDNCDVSIKKKKKKKKHCNLDKGYSGLLFCNGSEVKEDNLNSVYDSKSNCKKLNKCDNEETNGNSKSKKKKHSINQCNEIIKPPVIVKKKKKKINN